MADTECGFHGAHLKREIRTLIAHWRTEPYDVSPSAQGWAPRRAPEDPSAAGLPWRSGVMPRGDVASVADRCFFP